jgi:4-hydroxy 2-oxovalerate aldolase
VVTVVDCTLRDGGYYNEWDFNARTIERYLRAIARARIPVVELGFRLPPDGRFLGASAYTTDDYLVALDFPASATVSVMINAKDLIAGGTGGIAMVDQLFQNASDSPVKLVRIAANFEEIVEVRPAIERLHNLGYQVALNLMKISTIAPDGLVKFGQWASAAEIEVAYLADSFGSLRPSDIDPIVNSIRHSYSGPLGCHMHDNMSYALINSLQAVMSGVTWVDATILGMGRGPGNTRTEFLVMELERLGLADIDLLPLLDVVTDDFVQLQASYLWGANVYYFLAAVHGVHPTYIQEMTRDGRYTVDQIVGALQQLGHGSGASFTREKMVGASDRVGFGDASGTWNASDWCGERDVLIVGPGPEAQARRQDIERFIERQRPVVIALNLVPPLDVDLVDVYVMCDPVRATIDADLLEKIERPIVAPRSVLGNILDVDDSFRDFGLMIQPGRLTVTATGCIVPRLQAVAYAIGVAAAGNARRILLSGFDGFGRDDSRQTEMEELFELCASSPDIPEIVAITRSSYPVRQASLYGWS